MHIVFAYYEPNGAAGMLILLGPLVLAFASFWPAARAHWSSPWLAAPCVLLGLMVTAAVVREGFRVYPGILFLCVLYFAIGVPPILLWKWRRR
jgi:hypothetical protein